MRNGSLLSPLLLPHLALHSHVTTKAEHSGKNTVYAEVAQFLSPVVLLLEIHPERVILCVEKLNGQMCSCQRISNNEKLVVGGEAPSSIVN